jgi:hypothetical protein
MTRTSMGALDFSCAQQKFLMTTSCQRTGKNRGRRAILKRLEELKDRDSKKYRLLTECNIAEMRHPRPYDPHGLFVIKANKLRLNLREVRIIIPRPRNRGFKSGPAQPILCRCLPGAKAGLPFAAACAKFTRQFTENRFQRSSVVERSAVNRLVVGSNPTAGAISQPS